MGGEAWAEFMQVKEPDILLRATVFGQFRIEGPDGLALQLSNRRAILLLAILFLQADHSIERNTLLGLLWPDRFAAQAKASLRQCLHDLTRQLSEQGMGVLDVSRTTVSLDQAQVSSDLTDLLAALGRQDDASGAEALLVIGNRPVLREMTLNPTFDTWLEERRKHIDAKIAAAVGAGLDRAEGSQAAALREAARVRFPAMRFATRPAKVPIAVLPFPDPDAPDGDPTFADGIAEELSSRLGRIDGIAVAGRTSVAAVVSRDLTLPEIAEALAVKHLVEGHVRRNEATVEVSLALIDGATGTQAWSTQIAGTIEDIFGSRKVVGENVIAGMCRALDIVANPTPHRRMSANREAYTLYLQGRAMVQKIGVEGAIVKGIEFLEQALEIDQEFAECWTALANAHIMGAAITPSLTRVEQSGQAARCAKRAIELDPDQGHAYSILGIHEWTQFNPARALEMAFEAYTRDPDDADVCSRLGSCLLYLGKAREALPYVEAAVDRDPVYPRNYAMLTSAHLALGEIDKAHEAGQRMADLGVPAMWLALAQMAGGDFEAAVKTHYDTRVYLGTAIMRPPGMPPMDDTARDAYFDFAARGIFSGKQDDRAAYCRMLDGLHASMSDPYDPSIAFPAIWMGHSELAMKIYSECIHPANMFGLMSLWIDIDPINRTIRDSRFMDFAERIGMVETWERFGWPDLMPGDPRST